MVPGLRGVPGPGSGKRGQRAVQPRAAGGAARRRPAGVRQHDGGLVRSCLVNERIALAPHAVQMALASITSRI
ncbi:MAG: hypothetical protein WDN49_05970 [Acetobacteraceae bacterium]